MIRLFDGFDVCLVEGVVEFTDRPQTTTPEDLNLIFIRGRGEGRADLASSCGLHNSITRNEGRGLVN
jgi:hypothetical protein